MSMTVLALLVAGLILIIGFAYRRRALGAVGATLVVLIGLSVPAIILLLAIGLVATAIVAKAVRYSRPAQAAGFGALALVLVVPMATAFTFPEAPSAPSEEQEVEPSDPVDDDVDDSDSEPTQVSDTPEECEAWEAVEGDHDDNRWFSDGMESIREAESDADARAAAEEWVSLVREVPALLAGASSYMLDREVEQGELFDDDGCATERAVTLSAELETAVAASEVSVEDAPSDGYNSGVDANGVVGTSANPGVSGDRQAIRISQPTGETMWVMARCGQPVVKAPPKKVPKVPTDEEPPPDEPPPPPPPDDDEPPPPPPPEPEFACIDLNATLSQDYLAATRDDQVDASFTVEATAENTEILHYEWDFGDGQTATTEAPSASHTYTEPGTYTVRVNVVTEDGETGFTEACSASFTIDDVKCFDEDGNRVFDGEFCGQPDGVTDQEPRHDEVEETEDYDRGDAEETRENQDEARDCIEAGECDPHDPTEDGVEVPDSEDGGEAPGGDVDTPDEQESDDVPGSGDENPEHDGEDQTQNPEDGTSDPEDTPAEEDEEENVGDPLADENLPNVSGIGGFSSLPHPLVVFLLGVSLVFTLTLRPRQLFEAD